VRLYDPELLQTDFYIGGNWIKPSLGKRFSVVNPANESLLAEVADADVSIAEQAIHSAECALPAWRKMPIAVRCRFLQHLATLILQHEGDLATIITYEQGKPLQEAKAEVASAVAQIYWAIETSKRLKSHQLPEAEDGRRFCMTVESIGVVVAITPWNYPLNLIVRKCIPALAAGCTIVAKPAEQTPLVALAFMQLAHRAEFPAGILNMITAQFPETLGNLFTTHPAIRGISFTGSNAVGKTLLAASASTLKKVIFELGGNAPFIITEHANLEMSLHGLMRAKFRNAGQTCVSPNRILVQQNIYPEFVEKLHKAIQRLTIGYGWEPTTQIGPIIDDSAVKKIQQHVDDAIQQGASLICGGKRHSLGRNFYQPTMLTGIKTTMQVAQEETFGPVAALMSFDTIEEAITIANNTPYGLAAYIYDSDKEKLWDYSRALHFGMIGFNEVNFTHEAVSFGGLKESGIGREGGDEGINYYLDIKAVCFRE
jgi:succinate-semialdehyde dehydrogenase/glutarate-semialdehyde dehydrogenase